MSARSYALHSVCPRLPFFLLIVDLFQDSGTYKQCLGKSNRAECGCTDEMKLSGQVIHSDCIQRVNILVCSFPAGHLKEPLALNERLNHAKISKWNDITNIV